MVFLGDSCRCDLETWQLVWSRRFRKIVYERFFHSYSWQFFNLTKLQWLDSKVIVPVGWLALVVVLCAVAWVPRCIGVLDARNRSLSTSIGMCDFILQTWQQCSGRSCEFPQDDEYFSDAKAKQSTTSGSRSAVCDDVWWFLVRFFGCLLAAESMIPKKHRL